MQSGLILIARDVGWHTSQLICASLNVLVPSFQHSRGYLLILYIATIRCFVEQRVAVRHCRAIGVRSISNHTTYWIKYDNHFHTHTYCPFYLMSRRVHGEWVAINFMGNRFLNGDTWPMYVCNVKVFKHRQCRWTTKQWLQNYLFYE